MRYSDRGAATITTAIMAGAWVVMLAFVVVGGGRIRALQRADNIAAEAARAAGSAIDPARAVPGDDQVVDPVAAQQAALDYMNAVGAIGTIVVGPDGKTLSITVTITYANPTGMAFFGGASWEATGNAKVTLLVE
jgi:Flp pilus assembly protein TadG